MTSNTSRTTVVAALALLGGATAVTCAAPTEIVVEVYSEVDCGKSPQITLTGSQSLRELASRAPASVNARCTGPTVLAGRVVLRPSGDDDEAIAFQLSTRVDDQSPEGCGFGGPGCIVARRQLRFAPRETTTLRVDLRNSCANVVCSEDDTCVQNRCVSATVPEACLAGSCDESALVASGSSDGGAGEGGSSEAGQVDGAPSDDAGLQVQEDATVLFETGGRVYGLAESSGLFDGGALCYVVDDPAFGPGFSCPPLQDGGLLSSPLMVAASIKLGGIAISTAVNAAPVWLKQQDASACAHDEGLGRGDVGSGPCPVDPIGVAVAISLDKVFITTVGSPNAPSRLVDLSGGPNLANACDAGTSTLGYLEENNGSLYFAEDAGVRRVAVGEYANCIGASTLIVPAPGARGVAVTPAGQLTCASTEPGEVICRKFQDPTTVVVFRTNQGIQDIALRGEGASWALYIASPPGIWRMALGLGP